MLLAHCTWPEVEAYLGRAKGVILPVGSTEQHGPSGAIGTDALCAEAVARGIGEATGAMVAPTLAFGMAQHHLAFAGTMSLQPETLRAVLVDLLGSLARHGFERCLVINGHGGNRRSIEAALQALGPAGATLRCRARNWWSPPVVGALLRELFGDRDGDHATASEISMTQWVWAETRRDLLLEPILAPANSGFGDALDFRRRYPDGRIGSDPSLADPALGQRIHRCAVDALAAEFQTWLTEA
jgi:creatinine amidohydrolase